MKNDNPLSPHIQIYNWHISSLVSISHRVTGIINIIIITLICVWVALLLLGNTNYDLKQLTFLLLVDCLIQNHHQIQQFLPPKPTLHLQRY